MKGLLHSKKFRKNLYKWLCMYVGVLMLFTSVVTYSKYVANFSAKGEGRVAKFKIDIVPVGCTVNSSKQCTMDTWQPNQTVRYEFTVSTDFEVATSSANITLTINNNYFDDDGSFVIEDIIDKDGNPPRGSISKGDLGGQILLSRYKTFGQNFTKTFYVDIKYDPCYNVDDDYESCENYSKFTENIYDILTVSYVVEQKNPNIS